MWKQEEAKRGNFNQIMLYSAKRNEQQKFNSNDIQEPENIPLAILRLNKFARCEEVKTIPPGGKTSKAKQISPWNKKAPFVSPTCKNVIMQKTFVGLNLKGQKLLIGKLLNAQNNKMRENSRNVTPSSKNRMQFAKNSLLKNHSKYKTIKEKLKKTPILHQNGPKVGSQVKGNALTGNNFSKNEAKEETFMEKDNGKPFLIILPSPRDNSAENKKEIILQKKEIFNKQLVLITRKIIINRLKKKS